jgi:hypothetical protein
MEVTTYGVDVEIEDSTENKTVGKIIDELEEQGAVVMKAIADGQEITNFNEDQLEEIKPIEQLELVAKDMKELINEGFEEAESYLPRLISGIDEIINNFSQGNYNESYQLLEKALEGFEWLNLLFSNFEHLPEEKKEKVDLEENLTNWKTALTELLKAVENQDTVLINDLLEYELVPILEEQLEKIKEING